MRAHPLLVWFARTQDPAPMTVGRVPGELAPPRGGNYLKELLEPHGHEQQLSIPSHLGSRSYRAFVLAQGRDDFSDEQLDLARRLQPLLALLDRQAEVTSRVRLATCSPPADLTAREVAVLGLLAEGLTAAAIGRRLQVSPRTVHCHLGHVYRKLGVVDRMMAVTVARELGLVPAAAADPRADGPGLSGPSFEWPGPPVYGPEEAPADT
ncbi:LuxR family transcriptional regulator [Nocardioides euryhalodurans]|uniref:LuxR family transcriptional regulator n=2 Tax=Nocardioides euryhalodurans TaxID=2518370 RepID=A0A4P7GQK9_9ACTN|nr:LuxR family transcriptional regulator [Nocardioides euryhalodurans]